MASGGQGDRDSTNPRGEAAAPGQTDASPQPAQRIHETETIVGSLDAASISSEGPRAGGAAPGAVADLDEFKRAVIELGVVGADELGAFEVDPSSGLLELARALVRAGRLTPYQSAAIYQKKSRGLLIGNYIILDKLGVGGMGVVFKARHRRLGRIGALKILPPSFARDKSAVMRFRREVEAAGRLKHPNIVAALDADEDRGVHFLVMDYVAGSDLDRVVQQRGPMPVLQAVDCIIQAARGLEAAHAAGIVHRDIKPGNLMLDTAGTIRVLDLGLARIVDAANPFSKTAAGRLTESGMYMGTVDYMAPEQAEDSHRVDHRADIYSLGCTLYYLLTGQEPFPAETVLKRLLAHMERPAPSIRALRPTVAPAVDSAHQKMMAKRPDDRPASMTEVIALLESCKASGVEVKVASPDGEAPKSRPELKVFNETPLKRAGSPRTKAEPSIFAVDEPHENVLIDHDLNLEDLVMDVRPEARPAPLPPTPKPAPAGVLPRKRQATRKNRSQGSRRGLVIAGLGTFALVAAAFVRYVVFPGPVSERDGGPSITVAKATAPVTSVTSDVGKSSPPTSIAGSEPRGDTSRRKSTAETKPQAALSASVAKSPTVVESLVETARFVGHQHNLVESVHVLPDGKRLLTTSHDGTARLWDIGTARELLRLWHPQGLRGSALVNGSKSARAVTGCFDGVVRLWDLETGRLIGPLARHSDRVEAVAVSPDGRFVLSGGDDEVIILADLEKRAEIHRFKDGAGAPFYSVAFSPDGQRFLAGDNRGGVWLGEARAGGKMHSLTGKLENVKWHLWGIAFTGDGRHGVSETVNSFLTYWDLDAGSEAKKHKIADCQIRGIAIRPDGYRVVFATQFGVQQPTTSGAIGLWDVTSTDPPQLGPRGPAHTSLSLLPDGAIATSDIDGIARIWRPLPALASARSLAAAGKSREALAEYGNAMADRPDDAPLLIERGRLLAEIGEAARAHADFTRAAQLATDNPQLFLNSGWWAAGPYPPDLKVSDPIESERAPDPSQPAPAATDGPRRWRSVPIEMQGKIDLRKVFNSDNVAAYALSIVYATARKDVVLLIATDDAARVWLNGRLVLESPGYTPLADGHAVAVTLQPGRNTLLAKVANQAMYHTLQLRMSDSPAAFSRAFAQAKKWDQAIEAYNKVSAQEPDNRDILLHDAAGIAFAQSGRWKDAKTAFERGLSIDPSADWIQGKILPCYIVLNDVSSYRILCEQLIARIAKDANRVTVANTLWLAALLPDALAEYNDVLKRAKKLMDEKAPGATSFRTYGALLYRAKQYPNATGFLNRSIEAQNGKGNVFDWVFLAMARHRAKQPGDRDALAHAKAVARSGVVDWTTRAEIDHLLAEADQELRLPAPP